MADEQRKLSTLDFKHNPQHVSAAAAASTAQQHPDGGIITITNQGQLQQGQQQIVSQQGTHQVQQQIGGPVATLLQNQQPQQQQIKAATQVGTQHSPNGLLTGAPLAQTASNHLAISAPPRQIEPMFHTVPPRPQRLLHSEAYIRYE